MKTTVTFSGFVDAFRAHGREEQFSYGALRVLFDYLEQLEEDTGESIDLDVIALCCDYAEGTSEDVIEAYNVQFDATADDADHVALQFLEDNTVVCGVTRSGDIVYCSSF